MEGEYISEDALDMLREDEDEGVEAMSRYFEGLERDIIREWFDEGDENG